MIYLLHLPDLNAVYLSNTNLLGNYFRHSTENCSNDRNDDDGDDADDDGDDFDLTRLCLTFTVPRMKTLKWR